MSVLGTGGLLYKVVTLIVFIACDSECDLNAGVIDSVTGIIFILLQTILLLNFTQVS